MEIKRKIEKIENDYRQLCKNLEKSKSGNEETTALKALEEFKQQNKYYISKERKKRFEKMADDIIAMKILQEEDKEEKGEDEEEESEAGESDEDEEEEDDNDDNKDK